ncbi:MAG: hypothetical protein GXZ13_07715 [Synergistaceae bacterium]|nr:hypothetical protein [Synergistaceae bacterium]
MIPEDVENRIAKFYFHNYLPWDIMEELEMLLLPFYLPDGDRQKDEIMEEEIADEVVKIGIEFLMAELEKRNKR